MILSDFWIWHLSVLVLYSQHLFCGLLSTHVSGVQHLCSCESRCFRCPQIGRTTFIFILVINQGDEHSTNNDDLWTCKYCTAQHFRSSLPVYPVNNVYHTIKVSLFSSSSETFWKQIQDVCVWLWIFRLSRSLNAVFPGEFCNYCVKCRHQFTPS